MQFWYKKSWLTILFIPLSWLYTLVLYCRKLAYQIGIFKSYRAPVPVIVVGNITVGGTGKTPTVIYLAKLLTAQGLKVAVISRGYTSKSKVFPLLVTSDTTSELSGDEALLMAKNLTVPIVIGANRQASIELLLAKFQIDVIISDDGLQHYALQQDYAIVLVDSSRNFGNQYLLPAGPLREPIKRLNNADLIIYNGLPIPNNNLPIPTLSMQLQATSFVNLVTGEYKSITEFQTLLTKYKLTAIAGIGNPQRFFTTLQELGLTIQQTKIFADHHQYSIVDFTNLAVDTDALIVMTEKDAVKVTKFAKENYWYLQVEARFQDNDVNLLTTQLQQMIDNFKIKK